MQADPPLVSIIIPVKNEERMLRRCLESIRSLDYAQDRLEVIIADGRSRDSSRAIAEQCGARVVDNPKGTVAAGRNRGLAAARGEFIAFTDADCEVSPEWLKTALSALRPKDIAGVSGITLFPDAAGAFERAVNFLFMVSAQAGYSAHRQHARPYEYVSDLPGCNAIYRRTAIDEVMPIDENLLTGEDVWLNWLLRQRGYRQLVTANVRLWHHRRTRPGSFFRQMYRFAIGRLQVGKRARPLLKPAHVVAGVSLPLFVAVVAAAAAWHKLPVLGVLAVLVCALIIWAGYLGTRSIRAACQVPVVFGIFLAGWSLGFLRELLLPLRSVDGC